MAAPISLSSATSLEQQMYLCALQLQSLELAIPVETRPDNAQIAFDTESGTATLSVTLNTVTTVENGKAVIAVLPYLTESVVE